MLLDEMGLLTVFLSCVQILGGVFPLFGLQMYNALGLVSSIHPAGGIKLKRILTITQYVLPQPLSLLPESTLVRDDTRW
jgi:hypothetical protein